MSVILIVENNIDFSYAVEWHFEQSGFEVLSATTGENAIELFDNRTVDVVLLDINLDGEIDGKTVARHIRSKNKSIPVIFMSGESKSPADVVEGLEIGANFFLKKPLAISEIDAHVKIALKATESSDKHYQFDQCTFIPTERIIRFGNKKEYLSEKENGVLLILAENLSETVSLDEILIKVWHDTLMEESLRNIVSSLRKKIDGKGLVIETIKNKGYRLEEE